jgi:hypothetical protein
MQSLTAHMSTIFGFGGGADPLNFDLGDLDIFDILGRFASLGEGVKIFHESPCKTWNLVRRSEFFLSLFSFRVRFSLTLIRCFGQFISSQKSK